MKGKEIEIEKRKEHQERIKFHEQNVDVSTDNDNSTESALPRANSPEIRFSSIKLRAFSPEL